MLVSQVLFRLALYILTIILVVIFGVWGVVLCLPLFLYKEYDIIILGILVVWLSEIQSVEGYFFYGTVIHSLGKNGSILETDRGRLYWPKSKQYLGCTVEIEGFVYHPKEPENPGGFNQKRWLKRHGIVSILKSDLVSVKSCRKSISQRLYKLLHQRLLKLNLKYIPEIESLLWGSQPDKNYYWYGLGVIHFLSISGLHINGLYRGIQFMASYLSKKKSKFIALSFVFLYVALIGFPFCATRALLMLGLMRFPITDVERYLITLAFMLTIDPLAVLDMGAWFSFLAVWILMIIKKDRIYHLFLGLSLVSYGFGIEIQPMGLFANYLLTPYFIYGVFPLMIIGLLVPGLFDVHFKMIDELLGISVDLMLIIQNMHIPPIFYSWDKVISVMALIALRYWFSFPQLILWVLYLQLPRHALQKGQLKLDVLSVGHGLAVLVSTKNHYLLYDIGSQEVKDVTHQVLLPFLNKERVAVLDAVVISHPDYDHYSGLGTLLQDKRVKTLWASIPISSQQRLCQAEISWEWDDVIFKFIHPNQFDVWKGNNQSCVLKVTGKEGSVLLTGDIEKPAEAHIIQKGYDLKSTVLVAPHHGSHTSSHPAFLKAVMPEYIVVSENRHKRLKHRADHWIYPYFSIIL